MTSKYELKLLIEELRQEIRELRKEVAELKPTDITSNIQPLYPTTSYPPRGGTTRITTPMFPSTSIYDSSSSGKTKSTDVISTY
ncbi:MAG: hypothetical protein PHG06_00470 [Parabacteroides sp.]|nr:hypothetical protein [Parabacteroides sp.]